jgi:hypothetical protein
MHFLPLHGQLVSICVDLKMTDSDCEGSQRVRGIWGYELIAVPTLAAV